MQFIASRKKFYLFSGITTLLSFLVFFTISPNLGIDMTGGMQIGYSVSTPVTSTQINTLKEDILKSYTFSGKSIISDIVIYSTDNSSIRADIGLKTESDTKIATAQSNDLRARMPEFFKKNNIDVTEISFASVGKSF